MDDRKIQARGLTDEEVKRSRAEHGDNSLTRQKQQSFLRKFLANLNDPVIRVLLGALLVNIIFAVRNGSWAETIGIAIAVFLAAFISTLSEHSSQKAFLRLDRESEKAICRVRRVGTVCEIPLKEVVVGDIMLLSSGEIVAADGLMLSGKLAVDQSAMTGESAEVEKLPTKDKERVPSNKAAVFRGCSVISGEGEMVVAAVGDKTFLGEISREIQQKTRESPLHLRLSKLASQISRIGYIMAALVVLAYLFNAFVLDSGFNAQIIFMKLSDTPFLFSKLLSALTIGLTVIVMAVPEGLPMMIAVVLSSNLRKMMKDNVLVRKSVGIEAAGSMNILFTDKTGTLTEGKQGIGEIILGDGSRFTGFSELNRKGSVRLNQLLRLSCFYNTSSILSGKVAVGGNAADRALLEAAKPYGQPSGYRLVSRVPFDSAKKYSSVTLAGKERLKLTKGAPEILIQNLKSFIDASGNIRDLNKEYFSERVYGIMREGGRVILLTYEGDTGNSTLICAIELLDRERPEAKKAVGELQGAGIRVVMITGDSRETAKRIAVRCGIIKSENDVCITSEELSRLSDLKLRELLPTLSVVARALPTDKSRLVRVAQELGLVVGMTGDGVNDAPALRHADVGFAMGSGTQVAKEAGDIIILDNNLASIVKAVLYGRTVFKSIRKFVTLQLTMNFCACGVSMIGSFVGIDAPVTVLQMLWINMIMDTLGGLAFAGEAPRVRYMKERPKRRDEPILNGYMVNSLILHGGFTLALGILFLTLPQVAVNFRGTENNLCLLTAFFAFFIFSSVLNCFCARTDRLNLFSDLGKNKIFLLIMLAVCAIQIAFIYLGGDVLRTMPLTPQELRVTLTIALFVIPADFVRKLLWRFFGNKNGY